MSASKSKATPVAEATPAPAPTKAEKALAAIAELREAGRDREAVLAVLDLRPDQVTIPEDVWAYVDEHSSLVFTAATAAQGVAQSAEAKRDRDRKTLEASESAFTTAATAAKERQAECARFVFRSLDIHHHYRKAQELADRYGLNRNLVSVLRFTGMVLDRAGSKSPNTAAKIASAATRTGGTAKIKAALSDPKAKAAEIMAAVDAVNAGHKAQTRAQTEAARGQGASESPEMAAHLLLVKAGNAVQVLNKGRKTVADRKDVKGEAVVRQTTNNLIAYLYRTGQREVLARMIAAQESKLSKSTTAKAPAKSKAA